MTISRSEVIEAFAYLDDLRESGETNMYGASPYLMRNLGLDKKDASKLLSGWMQTFDGETSPTDRADDYLKGVP